MRDVADLIRRHGAAVRAALGDRLLPSQARVLRDLVACRTAACAGLLDHVAPEVWTTPWVVHAQPAGDGARVLDYLARDLFRVAICNSRLEHIVTFRSRDHRTQAIGRATLTGVEFLHRFLQHVLPRRCAKVRYYGLWSATRRADLAHARTLLDEAHTTATADAAPATPPTAPAILAPLVCPLCHTGTLTLVAILRPLPKLPP
jgi:hypothetical protein